ncbi:MAG: DUF3052 domain-containing protein [Ignavibacteriales bacterium]|nr:DUF3052 domain-containing protein [Ignavibacteriales bacterium]
MKPSGYSGTPLAKKLGIKNNFKIRLMNQPHHYFDLFTDMPPDVRIVKDSKTKKNLIHYFTTNVSELKADIKRLRDEIEENGMIWISWPKKSANIATDLDENAIRAIALKNKLVDVKVCAIDEVWSGLKLVIRLKDRKIESGATVW